MDKSSAAAKRHIHIVHHFVVGRLSTFQRFCVETLNCLEFPVYVLNCLVSTKRGGYCCTLQELLETFNSVKGGDAYLDVAILGWCLYSTLPFLLFCIFSTEKLPPSLPFHLHVFYSDTFAVGIDNCGPFRVFVPWPGNGMHLDRYFADCMEDYIKTVMFRRLVLFNLYTRALLIAMSNVFFAFCNFGSFHHGG